MKTRADFSRVTIASSLVALVFLATVAAFLAIANARQSRAIETISRMQDASITRNPDGSYDVGFATCELDKEALRPLRDVARIESLKILLADVDDDAFRQLGGISIHSIEITGTPLSMSHMHDLANIEGVKKCHLHSNGVTDETIAPIMRWTNTLKHLWISANPVSDATVRRLAGLVEIEVIGLPETRVTNADIAGLAKCRRLTKLSLDDTMLVDVPASLFSKFPSLTELRLHGITLDQESWASAELPPTLALLDLYNTPIDDEALRSLERRYPHLRIPF